MRFINNDHILQSRHEDGFLLALHRIMRRRLRKPSAFSGVPGTEQYRGRNPVGLPWVRAVAYTVALRVGSQLVGGNRLCPETGFIPATSEPKAPPQKRKESCAFTQWDKMVRNAAAYAPVGSGLDLHFFHKINPSCRPTPLLRILVCVEYASGSAENKPIELLSGKER